MVRIGNLARRIAGKTEYELSLFPLETVLFPATPIHLHIFEPRYLAMIKRCLDENRPFGVTLIRRGQEAGAELAEPHPVGCTARIAAVDRLEDGRLNLTALGEERFRILELSYDLPYLVAKVEGLPINRPHSLEMLRSARRLAPWVRRYLTQVSLADPESEIDLNNLQLPDDPLMLTCWAAALLQIPAYEKQPLLEVAAADELLAGVLHLYRRETTLLDHLINVSEDNAERATGLN